MSDLLYEFKEGPYDILNFTVEADEGKVVIEINEGDLGRLPIEDLETVEELREALDRVESHLKQLERRGEEL